MIDAAMTARTTFEDQAVPQLDALFRMANRLTRDAAHAEDLVQETMLKAYRGWHGFKQGTNVRAWLLTILRNTFIDQYHKAQRGGEAIDFALVEDSVIPASAPEADPEAHFYAQLVDEEIIRAIDALPDAYREALVLRDIEGLAYSDIVTVLNVPLGTIKSRLSRARQILQVSLHQYAMEHGYLKPTASPDIESAARQSLPAVSVIHGGTK